MENLAKFSTSSSYEATSDFPNVAAIEEDESMCYMANLFKTSGFVAGDIVLWNGEKKVVVEQGNYTVETFPTDRFVPIGVVAIPESHMDDGRARMMATKWMNCDDPENGSLTNQTMAWGSGTDISGLTNFEYVPTIHSVTDQEVSFGFYYGFVSSDFSGFTGTSNPQDPGTRWNRSIQLIISPYSIDGTLNSLYRDNAENNALSYFDGIHQTDVILETRGTKDYGTWKPDSGTPEDYPAASCCDMYHTVGTSQGDWYLPSSAELGYVASRLGTIIYALEKVNGMQELISNWAWASTEYDSHNARCVDFERCCVSTSGKLSAIGSVIAFSFV